MPTRTATTHWEGDLRQGSGTVSLASSGAGSYPVNFPKRAADDAGGVTSPEELMAAAHAACYAMSLANGLAKAGTPATTLEVSCAVTVGLGEGGLAITSSALTVTGVVADVDQATFAAAADEAKVGCPVSRAYAGIPSITVEATLA